MKTIFITISQGMLVRNILRSGGYALLKKKGWNIVVFFNCREIPDYFKTEFSGENITLISVPRVNIGRSYHWFKVFTHYFIWNKTMRRYFRYSRAFIDRSRLETFLHLTILRTISIVVKIPFTRRLTRYIDTFLFPEKDNVIAHYYDEYAPDLVFSTSLSSTFDIVFMKEAKRRKVITVSIPKSWDNLTKFYLSLIPDYFFVQNEILKERLIKLQDFPEDRIYVIGFPQFDWYARKEIVRSREEHLIKMGLDPKLPVIFFGLQGPWFETDYKIADLLYQWVRDDELVQQCQLIVRPYFKDLVDSPAKHLKGKEYVAYDDNCRISNVFSDGWDPSVAETIDFTNTIIHSDVLVNILSTLALDAASVDTPVVNVVFSAKFRKGVEITPLMQSTEHYQWVFDTNGTAVARTSGELKTWINRYLEDSSIKSSERVLLRDRLCYKIDGKSSERMVEALEEIINSKP